MGQSDYRDPVKNDPRIWWPHIGQICPDMPINQRSISKWMESLISKAKLECDVISIITESKNKKIFVGLFSQRIIIYRDQTENGSELDTP